MIHEDVQEDHEQSSSRSPRRIVKREAGVKRVVRTVELEPEDYARIALTMPMDLLAKIDEASKLYGMTRSGLIQNACKVYVDEDLLGTDWLRHLLQHKEVKKGSPTAGYNVDVLVDWLSDYYVPEMNEPGVDLYLTPEHLQIIRKALEPEKTIRGKNKWLEFCEKTGLDPDNIPKDRPVKLIFEVEEGDE
jgi:hypothetical protein